ncbi:MAG: hypothetical protein H0V77_08480 [Actinobacteria bacterium]|nr:hypothetical protein [Actinomycetota bacterium]
MTPVEIVLDRLTGVRRSGKEWTARCPAHEDRAPSLRVREGRNGQAVLHCFAGCSTPCVVSALGFEMRDLFVRDNDWKPEPRRKPEPLPAEFDDFLETLRNRPTWPFEWESAKLLAGLPIELARQDARQNWDCLSARGNIKLILLAADMIRGKEHIFHYSDESAGFGAVPHCPLCDSEWCSHIGEAS